MTAHPPVADRAFCLKDLFEKSLEKYQDRVGIICDGEEVTYRELDRRSNYLANGLVGLETDGNGRVALLMKNRTEYVVSEIGIVKAGKAKVLLNDMLGHEEIRYILNDSRTKILICGPEFVETVAELLPSLDHLEHVVCVSDSGPPNREAFIDFEELCEREADESPAVEVSPDDIVHHGYTGGTTGKPKGVLHTHRSRTMFSYSALVELDITGDDRLLLTTPLPHSAGSFFRSSLLVGATAVIRPGFDTERTFDDIETHDITWTFMVPTMIYRLLDDPEIDGRDVSSLRSIVYGAAPMNPSRLREAIDQFGPIFKQFYGQTEMPNLITTLGKQEHATAIDSGDDDRLSSAGRECVMANVKIIDTETGEEQPAGEPGEVLAASPYAMRGYFELPEKTAETMREGWIRTGDIGMKDEDGYVTLLDRMNDMVVTGGMNVYTNEVEDVLSKHAAVQEVAVIGVPDDEWGEAVKAMVIPRSEHSFDEADVHAFARERLSSYKRPKSIDLLQDFPKTPYGKIDKTSLRAMYWDDSERNVN